MGEEEEYMETFGLTAEELAAAGPDGGGGGDTDPAADAAPGPEDREEPDGSSGRELPPEPGLNESGGTPEPSPQGEQANLELARRQAEQARVDQIYADIFAGQVSPFTGQPIRTEADFLAWRQEKDRRDAEAARRNTQQRLQQAGVPPDALRQMIDQSVAEHPLVQQARQLTERAALERARAVEQQAQTVIAESLKAIAAEFPEIRTLEDIGRMPTAGRFNELVQQGLGLEDAFFLANRSAITQKHRAAARQAAVTAAQSKAGLNAGVSGGPGGQAVEVPAEMAEAYREMMPGASMEEIRAEYAKYLKAAGR